PWEPYYISDWGVFGGRMANDWNFVPGEFDGDAGVAGNVPPVGNWSAIRGGFNEPVMATLEEPVTITGKIEFIGAGPETYSALRYGLFYHDSAGVLLNAGTDSAYWNGVEDRATGYMFSPTSGTNVHANGTRGAGTLWRIDGGRWISTLHNNPWPIGLIKQSPHNAVATAGKYDFAISVKPQKDGTKELRFYLLKEDFVYNPKYFFGGIMIDTALTPSIYNDVCFAFRGDTSNIRSMKLTEIKVSRDEITIGGGDEIPGYLYKWAFIGDRTGGWKTTPGEYDGNVSISGDEPNTDWVAIRGEFDGPINIQENKELIVNGKLEFVNGGFESANSLRFGIFYSDSAGYPIIKPDSSIHWSGMENHHSGYLLIPPSGFSIPPSWEGGNQTGNCGAVVDDIWFNTSGMSSYPLGTVIQQPSNADATAGTYRFEIALRRMADSTTAVKASLIKEDEPVSYYFSVDSINSKKLSPTDKFNCVAFALDTGNTTTAINLVDVQYDMRNWVPVIENKSEVGKPEIFSLFQNYPNPFNPTTVISYKLPVTSDVCIKVYDLLGREVATVFEGVKTAGNYSVNFDASRLAGGIYLYQLKAGNHVEAKKFVLLK
ncbi:MAG: T9SS type A sorting domain-containing protein, partial [Candidatus Neomarinimicrobiota bacterium]